MKETLFSEVYGTYYRTLTRLINLSIEGELDLKGMRDVIAENAYAESALTIEPALRDESWQLMDESLNTPIINPVNRPYTLLELRFLKTISLDPRMALFETDKHLSDLEELKDIEPLFMPDDVVYFDRYLDGDPYENEQYQKNFHQLLRSIHEKSPVSLTYMGPRGTNRFNCWPYMLEFSEKDDKFRTLVFNGQRNFTLNLSRIGVVKPWTDREDYPKIPKHKTLSDNMCECVIELVDERNVLERALLHFAHFEKTTTRLDDKHYEIRIKYNLYDETEILIRVLSFGPLIRVTSPESFVDLIKDRLKAQKNLL